MTIQAPEANRETSAKADRRLASQWAKLGIGFNVRSTKTTPDLELLLIATTQACPHNARLFILGVTWLAKFGIYVAAHRLKALAVSRLDPQDQATLAVLLETAVEHGGPKALRQFVVDALSKAPDPGPLLDVDRDSFADLVEAEATEVSKHWGRWVQPIEPKPDALRAPGWIVKQNPSLAWRAAHKGYLRCSLVETLSRTHLGGPVSESELARNCGATRAAVRAALDDLSLELQELEVTRHQGRHGSQIRLHQSASTPSSNTAEEMG